MSTNQNKKAKYQQRLKGIIIFILCVALIIPIWRTVATADVYTTPYYTEIDTPIYTYEPSVENVETPPVPEVIEEVPAPAPEVVEAPPADSETPVENNPEQVPAETPPSAEETPAETPPSVEETPEPSTPVEEVPEPEVPVREVQNVVTASIVMVSSWEGLRTAINNAPINSGVTIQVMANIVPYLDAGVLPTRVSPIVIGEGRDITLTGGSITLPQVVANAQLFQVEAGGTLRLSDILLDGSHPRMPGVDPGSTRRAIIVYGNLFMSGNTQMRFFSANTTQDSQGAVVGVRSGGRFEMSGGVIGGTDGIRFGGFGSETARGAVNVYGGGTFIMTGGEISHNRARATAAGGISNSGTTRISGNAVISNNQGGVHQGSGVMNTAGALFVMEGNAAIRNNIQPDSNSQGAGIRNNGGRIELHGGEISGNSAVNNGGGVWSGGTGASHYIGSGVDIFNNTSGGNGGGVFIGLGSGTIGGRIFNNRANAAGGGVMTNTTNAQTITAEIFDNRASNGGGLATAHGLVTLNGAIIRNNRLTSATGNGGGIHGTHNVTLNGGTVISGHDIRRVYNSVDGTFVDNSGTGTGGGIHHTNGTLTINNGIIHGNAAAHYGGGIHGTAALNMTGGEIHSNRTSDSGFGGGISRPSGHTNITGGIIRNNQAFRGAGIAIHGTATSNIGTTGTNQVEIFENRTLTQNNGHGAGLFIDGTASVTIGENTTIRNNFGFRGHGVAINSTSPNAFTMNGGSIVDNRTTYPGLHTGAGSGVWVYNGVFRMNGGTIRGNISQWGGGVYVSAAYTGGSLGGEFIMNGGVLEGNTAVNGGGIASAGVLTIGGNSVVQGNTTTGARGGGGVHNRGQFTLEGNALIADNNVTHATPVGVGVRQGENANATFTMNGGTIRGHTGIGNSSGGGVQIQNGRFIMNSGLIINNSANNGGGLHLNAGTTAEMNGGSISGNRANSNGGGIWVNQTAQFSAEGGMPVEISYNFANQSGGGIFTQNFNNSPTLPTNAYSNVRTDAYVHFTGNDAGSGRSFSIPNNPPEWIDFVAVSEVHTEEEGQHPLNNYDINYYRSGNIELLNVPDIHFGTIRIQETGRNFTPEVPSDEESYVYAEVVDDRSYAPGYELRVAQVNRFELVGQEGALLGHDLGMDTRLSLLNSRHVPRWAGGDPTAVSLGGEIHLHPDGTQHRVIQAGQGGGRRNHQVAFDLENVQLNIPNDVPILEGRYEATLRWTLLNVPGQD